MIGRIFPGPAGSLQDCPGGGGEESYGNGV